QQQLDRIEVVRSRSPMKRRRAVRFRLVDVSAAHLQGVADRGGVSRLDCIDQPKGRRSGGDYCRQQDGDEPCLSHISTDPVLSPNLSTSQLNLFTSDTIRFAIGVSFAA